MLTLITFAVFGLILEIEERSVFFSVIWEIFNNSKSWIGNPPVIWVTFSNLVELFCVQVWNNLKINDFDPLCVPHTCWYKKLSYPIWIQYLPYCENPDALAQHTQANTKIQYARDTPNWIPAESWYHGFLQIILNDINDEKDWLEMDREWNVRAKAYYMGSLHKKVDNFR